MIGITEAAKRLNISDTSINRRIRKLSINKVKKGRLSFITEDDFELIKALNDRPKHQSTPVNSSQPVDQLQSTPVNSSQPVDQNRSTSINPLTKIDQHQSTPVNISQLQSTPINSEDLEILYSQLTAKDEQLQEKDKQLQGQDKNHAEQLELLRKQMEHERWSTGHQLSEKDKQIAELQKALDQQQQLHGLSMQRIKQLEHQVRLLEHQPDEKVYDLIDMLEKTRDSFLANRQMLSHKNNKVVSGSFYQQFAKAS